ncbi:rhodanese-like domain-containing protein [Paenibacillus glacialis]|uniref:Sulfurtransferase n=1 Tax=Paenibacillus glacialis TaxID=494026 RepID=A0A168N970_9BACL|nr:rhodanese-like domain-containing protein [Paenibacillus glacialis]OAB45537.1 sulfurtransferase [Paenibacillus glacialis]
MIYTLIIVVAIWFMYTRFGSAKNVKSLRDEDFRNEMKHNPTLMLIDVREPHEFQGGYIPDAKNIPLSQLSQRFSEIPKDRKLLLYCRSGMRSGKAGGILMKQGYTQLAHLQGGIDAWKGKVSK